MCTATRLADHRHAGARAMRDERFPRKPMQQKPPAAEEHHDEDHQAPMQMAPPGVRH